jgi:hypothetical protein
MRLSLAVRSRARHGLCPPVAQSVRPYIQQVPPAYSCSLECPVVRHFKCGLRHYLGTTGRLRRDGRCQRHHLTLLVTGTSEDASTDRSVCRALASPVLHLDRSGSGFTSVTRNLNTASRTCGLDTPSSVGWWASRGGWLVTSNGKVSRWGN